MAEDRGWHQWEMACITDREVELFSKRNELIDTLSSDLRKKGFQARTFQGFQENQNAPTCLGLKSIDVECLANAVGRETCNGE
jgi:hypothetical protein